MSCRLVKVRMDWNEQRDFRSFFVPLEHHNLLGIMIIELMKKGAKTCIGIVLVLLLVACGGAAYVLNRVAQSPGINTSSDTPKYLYVYPESSWDMVVDSLSARVDVKHSGDLRLLLKEISKLPTPKVGAYLIQPNSTTLDLYRMLASGHQTPVRIVVPSLRQPEQMWQRLSDQVMPDSAEIAHAMTDTTLLRRIGVTENTFAYHIIPNTYEVYWSLSAEQLVERLRKESERFWTEERRRKAEDIGLTRMEVVTLASIVEEESSKRDEFGTIAGLYLNRLRIGMPLQADPTVKYAVGDFGLRRIMHAHLQVDSPYNTYRHTGLPPGPIRIPSIAGIDGVLNAGKHRYIYMCARPDFSGYHDFAETYAEHKRNARAYTRALNERGIR